MKWLTRFFLLVAAVLAVLLLLRQPSPQLSGGTALDAPISLPAIPLLSDQGQPTTLAASNGRMRLMFYGYVRCPDVCPATLSSLKNTYATLTPEQKKAIQIQFVTVDPAVDTPALVHEYLGKFNPDFTGLTGTSDNINAAAKAMFVGIVDNRSPSAHAGHDMGSTAPTNGGDEGTSAAQAALLHGDQVSVINPAGQFVRVYNNQEVIAGTLQKDIPALLRQYGP